MNKENNKNGKLYLPDISIVTQTFKGAKKKNEALLERCWCCKPKYRANIIYRLIFVLFIHCFYHCSCRNDQFTVLIFKFGTDVVTDPGLLKSG